MTNHVWKLLVDKRILGGGIAMFAVGISILIYLNSTLPVGVPNMSEEETIALLIKQQENQDMQYLAGMLMGIGFLLILISFGARRRKEGGAKKIEKKPAT